MYSTVTDWEVMVLDLTYWTYKCFSSWVNFPEYVVREFRGVTLSIWVWVFFPNITRLWTQGCLYSHLNLHLAVLIIEVYLVPSDSWLSGTVACINFVSYSWYLWILIYIWLVNEFSKKVFEYLVMWQVAVQPLLLCFLNSSSSNTPTCTE